MDGSGWRCDGRRGARHSGAQLGCSGEQLPRRGGKRERKEGTMMTPTTMRSSGGGLSSRRAAERWIDSEAELDEDSGGASESLERKRARARE
jgi:hypothetical protein